MLSLARPTSTPNKDMMYNLPAAPQPMNGPHGHLAGKKIGIQWIWPVVSKAALNMWCTAVFCV